MRTWLRAVFFLALFAGERSVALQCMSEDGEPVDWWIIYKLPTISNSSDPTAQSGFGYAYMDETSTSSRSLQVTERQLNTYTQGALGGTLAPIYASSSDNIAYYMYNDQWPGKASTSSDSEPSKSSYGHTKGVVAFDSEAGFWLIHSVPRFPNYLQDGYEFPDKEATYGQSFLCVSWDLVTLNEIMYRMVLNHPAVYQFGGSADVTSLAPNFELIITTAHNNSDPYGISAKVTSLGGNSFTLFNKNADWDKFLYEDLVAPTLNTDLYCETWMRPAFPSFCRPAEKYDVINVETIAFNNETGIEFSETKDHSKWCVSTTAVNWACVGDINRMESQNSRAGGTLCMQNKVVWESFFGLITRHDDCPKVTSTTAESRRPFYNFGQEQP